MFCKFLYKICIPIHIFTYYTFVNYIIYQHIKIKNKIKYKMDLYEASKNGDVENVKLLLSQGIDPNFSKYGIPVLYIAAQQSNNTSSLETVKTLIDEGADVNILTGTGYTPLMTSSEKTKDTSSLETVKLLLDSGADVNLKSSDGNIALMFAVRTSRNTSSLETVKFLIDKGSNVNTKDNVGHTPLMVACRYSHENSSLETVQLLLDSGANINEKNLAGETALTFAITSIRTTSSLDTVKLLLENGADVSAIIQQKITCPNIECEKLISPYIWKYLYARDVDTAKRYARQSMFPKDVWEIILLNKRQQLLCSKLSSNKNKEILKLFAMELNIPINEGLTKGQLCGLISKQIVYGKIYHNRDIEAESVKKQLLQLAKTYGIDTNKPIAQVMKDLGKVLI
jgi:ankyrin repeat protein